MVSLHDVPLFVLGKPSIRVLKHPTFGCLMDWYRDVTEQGRPVNPVALDLVQTVHSIARENPHRVRYTKTVEALYTAMSWNQAPPAREDWRVWQTIDHLHLTEQDVARFTDKARQAYYLGGVLVCMLTPEVLDGILNAGVNVKFISPTPATFDAQAMPSAPRTVILSLDPDLATRLKAAVQVLKSKGFAKASIAGLILGCASLQATDLKLMV